MALLARNRNVNNQAEAVMQKRDDQKRLQQQTPITKEKNSDTYMMLLTVWTYRYVADTEYIYVLK